MMGLQSAKLKIQSQHPLLWIAIFLSLAAGLFESYPAFDNPYLIKDDARANLFWLHHLINPELFHQDYLTDFTINFQSTGMYYLFTFSHFFIDPFLLAKILPFLLLMITGAILYKTGEFLVSPLTGLIIVILFLFFPSHLYYFSIGNYSNIFAWPAAFGFIYSLLTRRFMVLVWLLPTTALFYPIVFLIMASTYGSWVLYQIIQSHYTLKIPKKRLMSYFLASLLLSSLVIFPKYMVNNENFGVSLSHSDLINSPAIHKNGRNQLLPHQPVVKKVADQLGKPFILYSLLFLFALLGRKFIQQVPVEIWLYALSGIILYEVAYLTLLKFHFPYKYTRYGFESSLILVLGLGIGRAIEKVKKIQVKILSMMVFITIGGYFYGSQIKPAYRMNDYSSQAPLFQYIKNNTPNNSLISAPPYIADNIPLFSARRILFSHELLSPWFDLHAARMSNRIQDFYRAYYSRSLQEIIQFREKYQVDYIIVDQRDYRKKIGKRLYINPYNASIKKIYRKNKGHFYLEKILEDITIFKHKNLFLIDLKKLTL